MKQSLDSEIDTTIQNTIKIIANTASYGIHIQVNTEKSEKRNEPVTVYGIDESFSVDRNTISRKETPAKHFNPILGVFLPAAARLVLAAAESIVTSHRDGYIAYMDTDSIMVSPKHATEIQEFFQKLNPYNSNDVQVFKIEKSDDGKLLENVLFYGISSKRYVLFEYDDAKNKFNIHKFTSHGLAHLLDVDKEKWWQDILAKRGVDIGGNFNLGSIIMPILIVSAIVAGGYGLYWLIKQFQKRREMQSENVANTYGVTDE